MPLFIRFLILHIANGFMIGALAALALLLRNPLLASAEALPPALVALQIFALGAPCALGSLGAALFLDDHA